MFDDVPAAERTLQNDRCSALAYFRQLFDSDLIDTIVQQTNLYSVQQTGISLDTSCNEIEQFFGILLMMGIVSMPSYTDFWSMTTNYKNISDVMSLKRFQKIRRYLHFSDNISAQNSVDQLVKIRPVLDAVVTNCRKISQETEQSIDEMMVPYKGTRAGNLHQYIQNKPHKWGFKIFVRAGVSGIVYDFVPYTGKGMTVDLSDEERTLGVGGQVVVLLCKTIPPTLKPKVYFDHFSAHLS